MNSGKQIMKLRNQKEIGYLAQQQRVFAKQVNQFKNEETHLESLSLGYYVNKLQSVNIFEIHFGLLGISHVIHQNEVHINLLIIIFNFVQQDFCTEITKKCLSILNKLCFANQKLFTENCGIQILLLPHLLSNQEYFPKIFRIFSNLVTHLENIKLFRQSEIITMGIKFISRISDRSTQIKMSGDLRHFTSNSSLIDCAQIGNFYEECLISRNIDIDLKIQSIIGLGILITINKLQLTPKLISSLFSIYDNNLRCQNQIVAFFKKCAGKKQYKYFLIKLGLLDFLSTQIEVNKISLVDTAQILRLIIDNSSARANILVSHQVFQSMLNNLQELKLFDFLNELIILIDFKHLHQLIQSGLLRLIAKYLKYQMFKPTEDLSIFVEILKYINGQGKFYELIQGVFHFPHNLFQIEIEQLGILTILTSLKVEI